MPVLKLNIASNVYGWEIKESEELLFSKTSLSATEQEIINSYSREQRRKEMLATRALLNTIISNEHIHYSNKKPFLVNSGKEISISNSKETVVIQINEVGIKTGVDIQYFSEKVLRVKEKFLHPQEYNLLEKGNEVEVLNIIWSAKETLYKAYSENKLEFKKQIILTSIDEESISGLIIRNEREIPFNLGLFIHEDFVVTWYIN